MQLPPISDEQLDIIKNIESNNNIIVDAVSGSGKTSSNLHIAKHFKQYNILLLTYNSKLKIETAEKAEKLGLINLEVRSYHSFCCAYYNHKCHTDSIMRKIISEDTSPKRDFKYDLIVLDEAQDITELYYKLVCKIYKNNLKPITQICLFGDKFQSIFAFNGADERYIVYADNLFKLNNLSWKRCNLSTSFRITKEMALFVNKCLLKYDRIISNKISTKKPRYIICNIFSSIPMKEIRYYFDLGYKPSDIFILSPSIRGSSNPARLLANKLSEMKIKIYVPINDDEKLDDDILKDKMVFSSYHQVKGLERKVVIVFGIDAEYFKYYGKNLPNDICPNVIYVAATRASEHLSIMVSNKGHIGFLNASKLHNYVDVINPNHIQLLNISPESETKPKTISPTDLIRHIPSFVIDQCKNYFDIEVIRKKSKSINIPVKVKNSDETYENVAEITSMAISLLMEYNKHHTITDKYIHGKHGIEKFKIKDNIDCSIDDLVNDRSKLLLLANKLNSTQTGYIFKINQIEKYDWLSEENLQKCVSNINKLNLSNNCKFEIACKISDKPELYGCNLIGYFDCVDSIQTDNFAGKILYEFKCVTELKLEHHIQLAIYMYMHAEKNTKYILYNILTDECIELKSDQNRLTSMMELLVRSKYINNLTITDEEFITKNIKILNSYNSKQNIINEFDDINTDDVYVDE